MTGTTAGLVLGVTGAVVVACAAGAYVISIHRLRDQLESARDSTLAEGHLVRAAIEHQMEENDRSLIERMIGSFGREPGVQSLMLLDREGRVRYSSMPIPAGGAPTIDSPTCQACHQFPPGQRTASHLIELSGGNLLRTVMPLRNLEQCHRCHDPAQRINGILVVDFNAGPMRAALNRDLRWMVVVSGATALLLVAMIAASVRFFIMRRLRRFESTARMIAAGDLEKRVPVDGADTIAWLGREFNSMADSMTRLLGDVRGQREQLETVINSIDDGIVVLDPDRRVVAANDAFLARTGRSREDLLGSVCQDAAISACEAADCPTVACLRAGTSQTRILHCRAPGGETVWEEVHASPIRRPADGLVQVVEVWRNISERRAAEARLAESHRHASLGMLASGFCHELNTPLATVLACVESIQRTARSGNGEEAAEWQRIGGSASIARDQLLRCREITQHFLRISKGQGTPGSLVDLDRTFAEVTRLVEPTARAQSVTIITEPARANLHVRASEAELQQVVLNLLLNAIQACGTGGKIRLQAADGDPIRIQVTDDGCGIAPDDLKRIFEPFYSGKSGGTGLGLFLSLDIVRGWGGDLRVTSTPGSGSTFEVLLPAPGQVAPLRVIL